LGNIRLSYTKGTGENPPVILEENHYYPFGLKHKKYGSVDKDLVCIDEDCYEVGIDVVPPQARKSYQMKMQSKEFQDELGLNVHDFHFRQYMQDLGRTTSLDPYAENYYSLSPYSFLGNNPLVFADPDGKDYGVYIDHEKNTINIKSHYIVNSRDSELMNKVAKYYNDLSGNFVYTIGEGIEAIGYTINFEVTVEIDDNASVLGQQDFMTAGYDRAQKSNKENTNNEINSLVTSKAHIGFKKNPNLQGITGGKDAIIREGGIDKYNTAKHEVGHNFGMSHTSGLMHRSEGSNITAHSIGETLSRVGLGTVKYGDNTGNGAKASINGENGKAPSNFNAGSVITQQRFDRKMNRAIRRN